MKKIVMILMLTAVSNTAYSFGLPDLPGSSGGSGGAGASGPSASDAQEAIVGDFKLALGYVLQAQGHVATALGLNDIADGLKFQAGRLSGDDCVTSCLKEVSESSAAGEEKIKEKMAEGSDLDGNSKKELAKAFVPLGKGTYTMTKLAPKAKDWAKSASGEIKSAGLMGAAKLKKKLSSGLYIAKATPKLIKEWTKTTSSMVSFGKEAGVPTKGSSGSEMQG
jgi:hypothetical protein